MTQHSKRWLLIVDLDGVLLTDSAALARFREWYQSNSPQVLLAYFTDRSAAGVGPCFTNLDLPHPDYLITSLGTQIISFPSGVVVPKWPGHIHGSWNSVAVRTALETVPDLRLQSDEEQTAHKVSFFLLRATPDQIVRIAEKLAQNGIDADVAYSGELCLHVVPKGFGNGAAAEFLAGYLNVPRDRVTVCGTSQKGRFDVSLGLSWGSRRQRGERFGTGRSRELAFVPVCTCRWSGEWHSVLDVGQASRRSGDRSAEEFIEIEFSPFTARLPTRLSPMSTAGHLTRALHPRPFAACETSEPIGTSRHGE